MIKTIEVKGHSELAKKIDYYKKEGYSITFKTDGVEYCMRKGIRQIVKIKRA